MNTSDKKFLFVIIWLRYMRRLAMMLSEQLRSSVLCGGFMEVMH